MRISDIVRVMVSYQYRLAKSKSILTGFLIGHPGMGNRLRFLYYLRFAQITLRDKLTVLV